MRKTRVLVIDDSALMRQLLTELLSADRDVEVVGSAADPYSAWDKIKQLAPDVLTLDVEMPRMDGLTFLDKLTSVRPTPVIMVSALTERGCEVTLKALELGAVDFVTKPKIDLTTGTVALAEELVAKVKAAAGVRVRRLAWRPSGQPRAGGARPDLGTLRITEKVLAIGASTGGTQALLEVLGSLPPDAPGTVAVIHMPEGFTRSYARRLDGACQVRVSEARDGDRVLPGHVLIAPGNFHLSVVRSGAQFLARVSGGEPVNRHRPSVDVLFESCARALGANAIGVILTGMGGDGARGLLAMRRAGAYTVAQDEATCAVFGMPREAIALGAVDEVAPLGEVAGLVLRRCKGR
jgi:two-component system chemotaxis response regulator CheB